jgi:hypothetical protein
LGCLHADHPSSDEPRSPLITPLVLVCMDLRFRSVKRMFVMRPIKKHDPRHGCDYAAKSRDELAPPRSITLSARASN